MQIEMGLHQKAGTTLPSFVRSYIVTMRPYLLFVSGITGIAGLAFASEIPLTRTLLIGTAAFLSYGFGQALTDCFQVDTDSLSAPYRPLIQGDVTRTGVLWVSVAGLSLCVLVFALCNAWNLLIGFAAAAGLLTYTYFKRKWWAGPFYNAWIVTALFFMAFFAGGGSSTDFPLLFPALVIFFGYANFVLAGYFKDIAADRATGYNTLPVAYGRRTAAFVSHLFAATAVVCAGYVFLSTGEGRLPWHLVAISIFAGPGIAVMVWGQVRLHKVRTDVCAHRAIVPVVNGYILLLSGLAVRCRPDWFIPLMLFYLAFAVTLAERPSREQI